MLSFVLLSSVLPLTASWAIHLQRVIFHLSCLYSNLTADESSQAQGLAIISLPVHTNLVVNDDGFR